MELKQWDENTSDYTLSDIYSLYEAEPTEWGVYYSVYYNMEYNGFFRDQGLTMNHFRKKFWVLKGSTRIGGVIIAPNIIFGLFFIPPFNDEFVVMKLLKTILLHWSDRTKNITAFEILPNQIDLFSRAGFWPDEFRCRWMQRPTEVFTISWDDNLFIDTPKIDSQTKRIYNDNEIAKMFYIGGKDGINDTRRKTLSLERYLNDIKDYVNYTNETLLEASTLIYDKTTNRLVAGCLITLQDNYSAVYDITVLPSMRNRGLATNMLKRALSVLTNHYPILRLYVMQGNDAESVYYNLGFIPGVLEVQTCYIPASKQEQ